MGERSPRLAKRAYTTEFGLTTRCHGLMVRWLGGGETSEHLKHNAIVARFGGPLIPDNGIGTP